MIKMLKGYQKDGKKSDYVNNNKHHYGKDVITINNIRNANNQRCLFEFTTLG